MSPSTLAMLQNLEERGFTLSQSEGILEQVMEANSDLVTKEFLRAELADLKIDFVERNAQLEIRMTEKIERAETRMTEKLMGVVGNLKTDLIKWIVGLQLGTVTLILGLIYFLHSKS